MNWSWLTYWYESGMQGNLSLTTGTRPPALLNASKLAAPWNYITITMQLLLDKFHLLPDLVRHLERTSELCGVLPIHPTNSWTRARAQFQVILLFGSAATEKRHWWGTAMVIRSMGSVARTMMMGPWLSPNNEELLHIAHSKGLTRRCYIILSIGEHANVRLEVQYCCLIGGRWSTEAYRSHGGDGGL